MPLLIQQQQTPPAADGTQNGILSPNEDVWEAKVSRSQNRVYYKNNVTGETRWAKPGQNGGAGSPPLR